MPKSMTFTCPSKVTNTLSGLTSAVHDVERLAIEAAELVGVVWSRPAVGDHPQARAPPEALVVADLPEEPGRSVRRGAP